jgi:predicted dehydrogenase
MVQIGIAGIGFMGMIHYLAAQRVKGARVTAVASRDPKKLRGDWRGIRGNFGPAGTQMDLGKTKCYADFTDMIADPEIDLIDICTPTYLHESMAIAALSAGKHVLVEKAIALEIGQADAMLRAAGRAGRLLMVGHVLPFFPEFAFAADAIGSGAFGKLLGGHFTRVISRPDWSVDIGDASKTGGPAVDLHIHDTHFIGLLAGMPGKVFSSGLIAADGSVEYLTTQYLYGDGGPAISCSSGALAMSSRPFVHGFELYLERATLAYESGTTALTVFTRTVKAKQPRLRGTTDPIDAFAAEIRSAVEAVASGRESHFLSGKLARDALVLCHKECQSILSGKAVTV